MRVSLRWLNDYIDLAQMSVGEVGSALTSLGHKVEGTEEVSADWTGVKVGRVEQIRAHPNADKIRLCLVNAGAAPVEVVCGAWNFEVGAKVALARPGDRLAGGLTIEQRTIRGVESNGMICSERELGLGDDHAGILVLDPDSPLGVELAELVPLPDTVFDLEITPNRPDVMSMVGVARELAAYFELPYVLPPTDPVTVAGNTGVKVQIDDPGGCYRFVARELRGARIGPSPFWLRHRLRLAGVRSINTVVDITNYIMLELGQPLHAFDLDRVAGESIVVRRARDGERLVTLDGVDRSLDASDLVVADAERACGLAGTMGGQDSEVSERTTRVLIEAATWDPPTIMRMSRRHGLHSEASARFERGVDFNLPPPASGRAARLMVELTGGEVLTGYVDEIARTIEPSIVTLPLSEVARVAGPEVPPAEVKGLLQRLHLEVEGEDPLVVTAPTYRRDLDRPVDLVEEVARLYGFDRFADTVPTGASGSWSALQTRRRRLHDLLIGAGLSQAVNLAFFGREDLDAFGYPPDHTQRRTVNVTNPLNEELASLRTALLPGLLRAVRYSESRGFPDVALFETGRVFHAWPWNEDSRVPDQPELLAFAIAGGFGAQVIGGERRPADVYTATGVWRVVAHGLALGWYELVGASAPGFHPGRCARVVLNGVDIGHVGEIHPATASAYGLSGRVAAGELDLAALVAPVPNWQLDDPSVYPPVEFDLAFLVDEAMPAASLVTATARAAADLLESARVFDQFRGGGLPGGKKSLAIRYVLRASDRTLEAGELAGVRARLIDAAVALGAELRGQR